MTPVAVDFIRARTKDANAYPAPILGPGTLELLEEGVRFRARRTRATLATFLGVTIGLLGVLAAAFLLADADAEPRKKVALAVGLGCGVLPGIGVYTLLHAHLRGPAVDVVVPWSALRVLAAEGTRYTLRLVAPALRGDVVAVAAEGAAAQVLSGLKGR